MHKGLYLVPGRPAANKWPCASSHVRSGTRCECRAVRPPSPCSRAPPRNARVAHGALKWFGGFLCWLWTLYGGGGCGATDTYQQNRHGHGQRGQLVLGDRGETRIAERTRDRVLAKTYVRISAKLGRKSRGNVMFDYFCTVECLVPIKSL